jgi:hypothetical protein
VAALATQLDIEARWRDLTPAETSIVNALLDDASALLRAEYPDIDDRIATGNLDADVVAGIVGRMVKRSLVSPDLPLQHETENAGPFSISRQFTFTNPYADVFLTKADRTLIEGRRPKAMSIRYW